MPWSEVFSITWKWVLVVVGIVVVLNLIDIKRELVKIALRIWVGILAIVIPMAILWVGNGISHVFQIPLKEAFLWTLGIPLAWHVLKLLILSPKVVASICRKKYPDFKKYMEGPVARKTEREAVEFCLDDHMELMRSLLGSTYAFAIGPIRRLYVGEIIHGNGEWLPGMVSWTCEKEGFFESRYAIRFQDGQEISVGGWWRPLLIGLIIWQFVRNWHS